MVRKREKQNFFLGRFSASIMERRFFARSLLPRCVYIICILYIVVYVCHARGFFHFLFAQYFFPSLSSPSLFTNQTLSLSLCRLFFRCHAVSYRSLGGASKCAGVASVWYLIVGFVRAPTFLPTLTQLLSAPTLKKLRFDFVLEVLGKHFKLSHYLDEKLLPR